MSEKILSPGRRTFLRVVTGCAGASALAAQTRKLLSESDRIDIGGKGQEVIDKAYQLGRQYTVKYGNCAQCTLAAIQDSVPFVPKDETVLLAATPLSGGATRTHNGNCGGFTGCGLAIGTVCGRSRANFGGKAPLAGQLILQVNDRFVEAYGGVLCHDIRSKTQGQCNEAVGKAAAWGAEILLKQFTNYKA
jgi:hypothetical protein